MEDRTPGYTEEELQEDLLENLLEREKSEKALDVVEIGANMGLERKEMNALIRQLIRCGFLVDSKDRKHVELTDLGRVQGELCLQRHQRLTEFIEVICGVEPEEAEENACRMEHVISENVIKGMQDYMRFGEAYDRELRNADLNMLYEEGSYTFSMSLYNPDIRYPRTLAKEFFSFPEEVLLQIKKEGSYFLLKDEKREKQLWYLGTDTWKKAVADGEGWRIPTQAFICTMSADISVVECETVIACMDGENVPEEKDYRELDIHIW